MNTLCMLLVLIHAQICENSIGYMLNSVVLHPLAWQMLSIIWLLFRDACHANGFWLLGRIAFNKGPMKARKNTNLNGYGEISCTGSVCIPCLTCACIKIYFSFLRRNVDSQEWEIIHKENISIHKRVAWDLQTARWVYLPLLETLPVSMLWRYDIAVIERNSFQNKLMSYYFIQQDYAPS